MMKAAPRYSQRVVGDSLKLWPHPLGLYIASQRGGLSDEYLLEKLFLDVLDDIGEQQNHLIFQLKHNMAWSDPGLIITWRNREDETNESFGLLLWTTDLDKFLPVCSKECISVWLNNFNGYYSRCHRDQRNPSLPLKKVRKFSQKLKPPILSSLGHFSRPFDTKYGGLMLIASWKNYQIEIMNFWAS